MPSLSTPCAFSVNEAGLSHLRPGAKCISTPIRQFSTAGLKNEMHPAKIAFSGQPGLAALGRIVWLLTDLNLLGHRWKMWNRSNCVGAVAKTGSSASLFPSHFQQCLRNLIKIESESVEKLSHIFKENRVQGSQSKSTKSLSPGLNNLGVQSL